MAQKAGPTPRLFKAYPQGGQIYAFSSQTRRWSVLELPKGLLADLVVEADSVAIEGSGQIFEFRGDRGEWTHTDLRKAIDSAIEAAGEAAK